MILIFVYRLLLLFPDPQKILSGKNILLYVCKTGSTGKDGRGQ